MPDREAPKEPTGGPSARLLRALIWAGVSLAPVAAAVVLLGATDAAERFAIVLIAVCVVLIGASMLVRSDPVLLAMDVEDRVAAEVDALRGGLREEFAAAARATHHRVQGMQEEIGRLRAGAVRPIPAGPVPAGPVPAGPVPAGLGPTGSGPAGPVRAGPVPAGSGVAAAGGRVLAGAAVAGSARADPGRSAGGRTVFAASAPGWPESDETSAWLEPGQVSGGREPLRGVRAPGRSTGGRERDLGDVRELGAKTGGRAAGNAVGRQPGRSGTAAQMPRQRGSGVSTPPSMAPVFRPPTVPQRRSSASPPGQYGTPRRPDDDIGYVGPPGYDGPPGHGGPLGYGDYEGPDDEGPDNEGPEYGASDGHSSARGYGDGSASRPRSAAGGGSVYGGGSGRGGGAARHGEGAAGGYGDGAIYGGGVSGYGEDGYGGAGGYGEAADHSDAGGDGSSAVYGKRAGHGGTTYGNSGRRDSGPGDPGYGDDADYDDAGRYGGSTAGGKRRADVTAVDLGYTGRRARPDNLDDSGEFDYGPDADAGYPGYSWEEPGHDHESKSRW